MQSYILKRSNRKTLSIEITKDCEVLVRAPMHLSIKIIEESVAKNSDWIDKHIKMQADKKSTALALSDEDIENLKRAAKKYIPERVEYYSKIMNTQYKGVKITSAKTRYGSCSADNSLCFSYILMTKKSEAIDYVIVHELAHTFEHNHSKAFYDIIEKYMPDYKERIKLLKNTGYEVR